MYKVMIVDDEPPIIRSVERIIAKTSPGFCVAAKVYNGLEALEKIPLVQPDIVFTDIKMPVMDGIAFVKKLNEQYPNIYPVIISGYQEFDYARAALKAGVVDYLLKPVEPDLLQKLLLDLSKKLDDIYMSAGVDIFQRIIHSLPVEDKMISQYINYRYFTVGIIRKGALSGRYTKRLLPRTGSKLKSLISDDIRKEKNMLMQWVIDSMDEDEIIVVYALANPDNNFTRTITGQLSKAFAGTNSFTTAVYTSEVCELSQLAGLIKKLHNALRQNLVIGKNQVVECKTENISSSLPSGVLSTSMENTLLVLIQNKSLTLLKKELFKLFQEWEQQDIPQIWVEKMLKHICRLIEKNSSPLCTNTGFNIEQQIEEVISSSIDFSGLLRGVWDVFEGILPDKSYMGSSKDLTQELFKKINTYICNNLNKPITLQNTCDIFGISQPYLSRLFRKYCNFSFVEYLTDLRVKEAKRLMEEYPDMLFKEIAESVGYNDQHYFSRVFKTIAGVTPSEFKELL